jgi:hypothetical protein
MPPISVRLLRLSLLALLTGGAIGAWLLGSEPWGSLWQPRLRAAHIQLMLFGWLLPFVMGTAYWMMPRHPQGEPRGPAARGWAATALLHLGVVLGPLGALAGWGLVARAGAFTALTGALLFLGLLWPRVRAFGAAAGTEARGNEKD